MSTTWQQSTLGLWIPPQPFLPETKRFKITLCYQGQTYSYIDEFTARNEEQDAADMARYMYTEGNYSCDCNRSLFLEDHCDANIDELPCGNTIELVSIEEQEA